MHVSSLSVGLFSFVVLFSLNMFGIIWLIRSILIEVWGLTGNALWDVVIMLNNLVIFHFTCIDSLSFFDIVVFFELAEEALDLMLLHRERLSSFSWDVLDETNHSSSTLRIEFFVIASFHSCKLADSA